MNRALRILRAPPALLAAAVAGALAWHLANPAPCSEPLTYRIGAVDPRFEGASASVVEDAARAAALWNGAAGKTLLEHSPSGGMPVNFVYDSRQQATDLGREIAAEQRVYDELEASIDAQRAIFSRNAARHERDVQYWNGRGGAPPAQREQLQRTQSELQAEQTDINARVARLNAMAQSTNAKIAAFNESAGTDFNGGEYIEDHTGRRIDIYEFGDRTQLVRVLAHEFGHALGLAHTEDPNSIMHAFSQGTAEELSRADLTELAVLCAGS